MTIKKEYTSDISKVVIFKAWISQDMVIEPITKIICDPVIGGVLELYSESSSHNSVMKGVFKEIILYEKLVYTWYWEGSEEETIVNVKFQSRDDKTIVKIEHSGFLTEESKKMHNTGWDSYFSGLIDKIKNS